MGKKKSTKYQVPSSKQEKKEKSTKYQVPSSKQENNPANRAAAKREIPKHPKLRGEWAELQFMARAAEMGLRIARPISDCYRWDVIVEHELGFHRVQVKSTTVEDHGSYRCVYFSSAKYHDYSPDDFDFLAAYVVPEDAWYIIPSSKIETSSVTLDPRGRHPGNKYAEYREAWHLLKGPGRFNIHACAEEVGGGQWAVDREVASGGWQVAGEYMAVDPAGGGGLRG